MPISSSRLRESLVAYAWSAWSALGVAGWNTRSFAACIDIDALVLLTGRLSDEDARLRDESIDWCASNIALVSRSRLINLSKTGRADSGWSAYAATLQEATKQRWPGAGTPFAWTASGKSRMPERAEGSTLGLRCRAAFGATARGEVVRILMLADSERALDARDVAVDAAYQKRAVAEALENLRVAGIVTAQAFGNSQRYQLRRRAELESILGPLPRITTSQRAVCELGWSVLRASETSANSPERVRSVEAARIVRELGGDVRHIQTGDTHGAESPSLDLLADACVEALHTARGS